MVLNKLGLLLVRHRQQRVVGSFEVAGEIFCGFHELLLDLQPLLAAKPGAERVPRQVARRAHPHRLDLPGKASLLRQQIVK